MKKIYNTPNVRLKHFETNQMICQSTPTTSNAGSNADGPTVAESKSGFGWFTFE